jgi:hypothetical protein
MVDVEDNKNPNHTDAESEQEHHQKVWGDSDVKNKSVDSVV